MTRFFPTALVAALVATGITFAPAASAADTEVVVVHYGDLDLGTEKGRTALDRRIYRAVGNICHVNAVRNIDLNRRCRESVMETVRPAAQLAVRNSADRVASADSAIRAVLR